MAHPELASEQAYVERAYESLEVMREAAKSLSRSVIDAPAGGTHQARYERDVFVQAAIQRLESLKLGSHALVFGRMDKISSERFYLGRVAVSSPEREPLVVDWRAPVAEAFYRATGRHPLDLRLRRHFSAKGRQLTGIEDESFSDADHDDLGLAGTGALMEALGRARTGHMRDIVSTIQREQDEIIRAGLFGILCVQGGPGTGKTAVALHRAAYLLFTFRKRLGKSGLLVIGPNPVFLSYIDQVLPALGESGAALSTIPGLYKHIQVRGTDERQAARLKGDPRMIRFLWKALSDRRRALARPAKIPLGTGELTLSIQDSDQIVRAIRRQSGPHNLKRPRLVRLVMRKLHEQYKATDVAGPRLDDLSVEEITQELRAEPETRLTLDRMWPVLSPEEFLHDLFSELSLLYSAGRDLLTTTECESLHRPYSESLKDVEWTESDIPLLDEATWLLGPKRAPADPTDPIGPHTYGHIVVDEAQDLSPMALRMLSRRADLSSMTLVGDIAQATGTWAPNSWDDVLRHLPTGRGVTRTELTVSYRSPSEVLELASRVLKVAAPDLATPQSVRSSGFEPEIVRCATETISNELGIRASAHTQGTLAVLCPPSMIETIAEALAATGVEFARTEVGLGCPVTIVGIDVAKGLEFDSVIVMEPSRIVRESPQGLRALYVALTRPTGRLTVLHIEDLPAEMGDG